MSHLPSFAVVIPMYNEEQGAALCVQTVRAVLEKMPHQSTLIVVEDGSSDGTRDVLETCIGSFLDVIYHVGNKGYGAALRTGAARAAERGFDYTIFMDSDLTNDPKDIAVFTGEMAKGIDVIKASRYIPGGCVTDVPFYRRCVSYVGNLIGRNLFGLGIKDCTNGFRAVKNAVLSRLDLKENSFEIIVEELYQCKFVAKTFNEVPVELGNRKADQRMTAFSYGPKTFYTYMKYALLAFLNSRPKNLK